MLPQSFRKDSLHLRSGYVCDETVHPVNEINRTVKAVLLYLVKHCGVEKTISITAAELSNGIRDLFHCEIPSNMIKKELTRYHEQLSDTT